MKNIHKLNLLLGILVMLLLMFSLLQKKNDYRPLTTFQAPEINKIQLITDSRQLEFNRLNNRWTLKASPDKLVQQAHIDKLLGILKTHSFRQFDNTENNRKAFQLIAPSQKIILNDMPILYGITDPTTGNRYILFENRIHLITDLYFQYLLAGEDFFTHP